MSVTIHDILINVAIYIFLPVDGRIFPKALKGGMIFAVQRARLRRGSG